MIYSVGEPFVLPQSASPLNPPLLPDLAKLRREYLPITLAPVSYGGVQILTRDDEVLRYLAHDKTESTWRTMRRTYPKIATSIGSLTSALLGYGWGMAPKKGVKGAGSQYALEVAEKLLCAKKDLPSILSELPRAFFEGWLPVQRMWQADLVRHKGKAMWGVDRIIIKDQDRYAFTPDRKLVWLGYGAAQPEILDMDMGWLALTSGSTDSPYGRAALRDLYLIWRIQQQAQEWFVRGARNAIAGIPVFEEHAGAPSQMPKVGDDQGAAQMQQAQTEAAAAMKILEEHGFLLTMGGLTFKEIAKSGYTADWVKFFNYYDLLVQLHIEGQHLTAQLGESGGGGRALGEVQDRTKRDRVRNIALATEPLIQQVIEQELRVNIPSIDEDDIPEFGFRITGQISMTNLGLFIDMGGRVDAAAVAADQGFPIASEDDDVPVLELQAVKNPLLAVKGLTGMQGEAESASPPNKPTDAGPGGSKVTPGPKPGPETS